MEEITHVVVRGDTLSAIARKYNTTVKDLAALNNIENVNRLYIGQVLIIRNKTLTASSLTTRNSNPYVVDITAMGMQSNSDNLLYVAWSFKTANTEKYEIEWCYSTPDARWFNGSSESLENDPSGYLPKESTYSPPDNAVSVKVRVRPIAKTYRDKNDNEVRYWTGLWTNWQYYSMADAPPKTPPVPSVKIDMYDMTVYNANLDINASHVEYEIVWGDAWHYKTGVAEILTTHAWYKTAITPSWNYKARARGKRGNLYSPWSEYSENVQAVPTAPYGIDTIESLSDTSVKMTWTKIGSAKTYSIQYAEKEIYFEGSNGTTTIDGIESTSYIITGLTKGTKYFFRLKCVNDTGSSGWCEPVSIIIGTKPDPPSTWSDRTIAIVGEKLLLSWLHNSVDGSEQKEAQIEITVDGSTVTHTVGLDDKEKPIDTFELDTSIYTDGAKIYWRVRTKGVIPEYSDWSIQRLVEVYAPATISVNVLDSDGNYTNTIRNFPFTITGMTGPQTQKPIMYSISIRSNESYIANTPFGEVHVNIGDDIYTNILNSNQDLNLTLNASDIDLESGINYDVIVRVTMDSGLSTEESVSFDVDWVDIKSLPNAEILFDQNRLSASLRPYCERYEDQYNLVRVSNGKYYPTNDELPNGFNTAISVEGAITTNGNQVYKDELDRLFYIVENGKTIMVTDILLSVYRRTHDGKFVEIETNMPGESTTFVTDPHPSLDYARYRIVSTDLNTGSVSYTDISTSSFNSDSIVIQWSEQWSNFIVNENNFEDVDYATGSMVKLPYNVSMSENNSPDISTINYIGREHPVSYYGTTLGVTASVTTEFDKTDRELIYALRRLSTYMGDVYLRLPTGVGYWANVKVSFDANYDSLVIPVTFDIIRVEGGV